MTAFNSQNFLTERWTSIFTEPNNYSVFKVEFA